METITPPLPSRRAFLIQWTLANIVAWIVGMGLTYILAILVEPLLDGVTLFISWLIRGAFIGFCFAVNHWIIFRPIRGKFSPGWHRKWFVGTVLGWAISFAIIMSAETTQRFGYSISGLIIGLGVGGLQWLPLRLDFRLSWVWLVGHPVCWLVGFAASDIFPPSIGFALTGIISGIISGLLLIFLLDQQQSPTPTTGSTG